MAGADVCGVVRHIISALGGMKLTGQKVAVRPAFFNRVSIPLGLALLGFARAMSAPQLAHGDLAGSLAAMAEAGCTDLPRDFRAADVGSDRSADAADLRVWSLRDSQQQSGDWSHLACGSTAQTSCRAPATVSRRDAHGGIALVFIGVAASTTYKLNNR